MMRNKTVSEIIDKFRGNKKLIVPVMLGFAAVILLLLSELIPDKKDKEITSFAAKEAVTSVSDYAKDIEDRLSVLISRIEGAGTTAVMVTLESGEEQVYAENEKLESDVKKGEEGSENNSRESEYLVIESGDGESGLTVKLIEPKIRGVAVVCEGANSAVVVQSIKDTVTALLDIGSSKVSVAKMTK